MNLTKIVNGKRSIKKLPHWYCLQKSTPERWFERWITFTCHLMVELGFKVQKDTGTVKLKGIGYSQYVIFEHKDIGELSFYFERKRVQEGGIITIKDVINAGDDFTIEVEINTVANCKLNPNSSPYMSRIDVGSSMIETIRKFWIEKSKKQ